MSFNRGGSRGGSGVVKREILKWGKRSPTFPGFVSLATLSIN